MIRKLLFALILIWLLMPEARASLGLDTQWDVRPTVGSSTNGGGFDKSTAGTNMAIFNNKNAAACSSCQSATVNISTTDLVTNGTTTIVSASANFSSAIVGNVVYITGGTGSITAQRYQVASVTNATTVVVDRSTGLTAGTGATINIGGALDDISTALSFNVTFNTICVKASGTLVTTANYTLNAGVNPGSNASRAAYNGLIGYTTTCGDASSPVTTIQLSTNSNLTALAASGAAGWWIANLLIDCNSLTTSKGINLGGNSLVTHVKVQNCLTYALNVGAANSVVELSEFTGCTSACTAAIQSSFGGVKFDRIYVHDNVAASAGACVQLGGGTGMSLVNSVIDTCTGTNADGVQMDNSTEIRNNTFFNATRYLINVTGSAGHVDQGTIILNNIFMTAGTACVNQATSQRVPQLDGNAYLNCGGTGGTTNIVTAPGTGFSFSYTEANDIQLTADPFIDSANANFNLNATAGGGAAIRTHGLPGTLPTVTGTGYPDMGAFQGFAPGSQGFNSSFVQ